MGVVIKTFNPTDGVDAQYPLHGVKLQNITDSAIKHRHLAIIMHINPLNDHYNDQMSSKNDISYKKLKGESALKHD